MTGTVPAVPAPPAGCKPVQADVNAWVTTPFQFLATKTVLRAQRQAAQALSAGIYSLVQIDTILEDPYGGWSAAGNASQPAWSWLCPAGCSGIYEVSMTGFTASQGTSVSSIGAAVYVTGAAWPTSAFTWGINGATPGASGTAQLPLTGGADYLQLYMYSTAGVNTSTTSGRFPEIEVTWVSI